MVIFPCFPPSTGEQPAHSKKMGWVGRQSQKSRKGNYFPSPDLSKQGSHFIIIRGLFSRSRFPNARPNPPPFALGCGTEVRRRQKNIRDARSAFDGACRTTTREIFHKPSMSNEMSNGEERVVPMGERSVELEARAGVIMAA